MTDYCHLALTRVLVLVALVSVTVTAPVQGREALRILNWPDYLAPDVVGAFERARDVDIVEILYDNDEARNRILVESDGIGFDLALVDALNLIAYRGRNWLAPIDAAAVPNLRHIDPKIAAVYPANADVCVPYAWGTIGIAYRADLVPAPVTQWRQLFEPVEALRGRIAMIGDARDTIGMALISLGYSLNTVAAAELAAAERLLMAQRPAVAHYNYLAINPDSALVSGAVWMAMIYSGDALTLGQFHPEIRFVVPEEGTEIWIDCMALLQSSPRRALALAFLDYLQEPAVAARTAQFTHMATPNLAAEALLPAAFRDHPAIYPGADVLLQATAPLPLPPRTLRTYATIFARVTR